MTNQAAISTPEISFKDFIFKCKRNRTILSLAAAAIVIQFAIFKYFYPFASFIHGDSFSYLNAAEKNLDINTYLIGYSKFLRLFSVFNRTDYILTSFQFLFIQSSALHLLFTLFYFYKPGKMVQIVLTCFIVFNPLFLHLGNLVSSDGFFLALSLTWFALLIWLIHKPSLKIVIWHVVILFIAFTVRYNAMIYPFISLIAFMLSKLPFKKKLIGLGLAGILISSFIAFTMYKYKKLTGYWQYSPFSGWQFANNAMYAYRYVNKMNRKPVPEKFQSLDHMIREYFDSTRNTKKFTIEKIQASTYYMWSPSLPLMKYRNSLFRKDTSISELKKWASMGPFYKSYGLFIIRQYPFEFIKHFLWPNANKYYAPPLEFLEMYNSGRNYITKGTRNWFGYNSLYVKTRFKNNRTVVLNFYPILSGSINLIMLLALSFYLILKGWNYNRIFCKGLLLGVSFWLLNAGFTICASSAALRFQSFPIILTSIYIALFIDWMSQLVTTMKYEHINTETKKGILIIDSLEEVPS